MSDEINFEMNEINFKEVKDRVSVINEKLRGKGFKEMEIDRFWANIRRLIPLVLIKGIENIKVCTGCGHLDIELISQPHLSCCPDNKYIPINQQTIVKNDNALPNL